MAAKAKMSKGVKAVRISVWDGFKGLVAESDRVYEIAFVPETNRATLTANGEFKISDMSLDSLKRFADINYGVPESAWKIAKNEIETP